MGEGIFVQESKKWNFLKKFFLVKTKLIFCFFKIETFPKIIETPNFSKISILKFVFFEFFPDPLFFYIF